MYFVMKNIVIPMKAVPKLRDRLIVFMDSCLRRNDKTSLKCPFFGNLQYYLYRTHVNYTTFLIAACAEAIRAIGTLYGEQLT